MNKIIATVRCYSKLIALLLPLTLYPQFTSIPDEAFEQALLDLEIDSDGELNGKVLTSDVSNLDYLDISNRYIENLEGIEDFVNLTELYCQKNYLLDLDLTMNIKLQVLNCSYASGYDLAPLPINLSNNLNLTYLNCSGNRLRNLNVSHLQDLETLFCNSNKLVGLDVSQNSKLEELNCDSNEILTLNVSKNSNLIDLRCGSNFLKSLDLSMNALLKSLRFGGNQISNIDLKKNTNLEELYFGSNPITDIDLSQLDKLKVVYSVYNWNLKSLDVSQNSALEAVSCFQNPNLSELITTNCIALNYINCRTNELNSLDVTTNENLRVLWCQNNNLKSLNLSNNKKLEFLKCENNELEALDLRNENNSLLKGGEIVYDGILQYMDGMNATENIFLKCIEVDDEISANAGQPPYDSWQIDFNTSYSEDCLTLGVDDQVLNQSVNIYPNPVKKSLTIESPVLDITKVEIFSLLGARLKIVQEDFESIDLEYLSKGIYMIKIQSEYGTTVKKLIKI